MLPIDRPPTSSQTIPYPAIEQHGVVGDRRTAALIASDGTVNWFCLPDYDGAIVFGALLDTAQGGHWKLGPASRVSGDQSYCPESMVLQTRWRLGQSRLVLTDAMAWPETLRPSRMAGRRVLIRRLVCERGQVQCGLDLQPGFNFRGSCAAVDRQEDGFELRLPQFHLHLWATTPLCLSERGVRGSFELHSGEEMWAVLELGRGTVRSAAAAARLLDRVLGYWGRWLGKLRYQGRSAAKIRRSALALHLLSYAPAGSIVAAPTASVPERIGGGWNADYRMCWVRDASLSLASLQQVGGWEETERYLKWLVARQGPAGPPLDVLYGIHGEIAPRQRVIRRAIGYRGSGPVRLGNHAYKQVQLDEFGFLADCLWSYLRCGGRWDGRYWALVQRCAEYVSRHWQQPGNGIWELPCRRHYVSSRVMAWVMLDRAIRSGGEVAPRFDTAIWAETRRAIHQEVMERGWSEKLGAFRQRYEAENLDAAALLIGLFGFLPGTHPRVLATVQRIAQELTIDGYVYRFKPSEVEGLGVEVMGQMEGAFLPCTFWLATAYVKAGQRATAQRLLRRVERVAGKLGLLAEAVDPRSRSFLGNTPLLFSHVEYIRAQLELDSSAPH